MPTTDRRLAVSADEARRRAGLAAFPHIRKDVERLGVGLEPELFPIAVSPTGSPRERLVLTRPRGKGVVQVIDGLVDGSPNILPRIGRPPHAFFYPLANGGRLTFEPGGLHVMLMGLTQDLVEGDTIQVTLIFEISGEFEFDVPVENN